MRGPEPHCRQLPQLPNTASAHPQASPLPTGQPTRANPPPPNPHLVVNPEAELEGVLLAQRVAQHERRA